MFANLYITWSWFFFFYQGCKKEKKNFAATENYYRLKNKNPKT